ncbi:hypothetical protein BDV59DRAFT_196962 [Aspergillus ambiguus]|uniref:uncharacterized protein n=1 Tax=Aspergillus ambiguus TaxID=176160 RepID=UPI003CCD65CA
MRLVVPLVGLLSLSSLVISTTDPLGYQNIAGYVATGSPSLTTALDLIKSRAELSTLAEKIDHLGGFSQAFYTDPTWKFTFSAPNNDAFERYTRAYFGTFETTPKGRWWLGNTLLHHYVPMSSHRPAATYLFVGSQVENGTVVLNQVGLVHTIDRILDPSAQIFGSDLPQISQTFIARNCSNPKLSYC